MNLKSKLRKYLEVVRITNSELFASPGNLIGRILIQALRVSLFYVLYTYVYNASGVTQMDSNSATKLTNVIWGLGFVQLVTVSIRNTFSQVKDEILTGQIALKLNKPYSFLIYYFFEALGQMPIKFVLFTITTFIVLMPLIGLPEFTALRVISFLFLYLFGVTLGALIQILVGLFAFWIENPDPIMWILNKLSWIFNGTFVPIALLPLAFQQITLFVPLSAPYSIGRLFEIYTIADSLRFLSIQIVWILIVIVLIQFIYRRGVKLVSINGG